MVKVVRGDAQQIREQGSSVFRHNAGKIEDRYEKGIQGRLNPEGAQLGRQHEAGHEGDLPKDTQEQVISRGKKSVGEPQRLVEVGHQNDGGSSRNGGDNDHVTKEFPKRHMPKVATIYDRTDQHRSVPHARKKAQQGRTKMEFVDEEIEQRRRRTRCGAEQKDKQRGFV